MIIIIIINKSDKHTTTTATTVNEQSKSLHLISGLSFRHFKGFPSLLEVECSGSHLPPGVELLSLKLSKSYSNSFLAYMSTYSKECVTYGDYSSCFIDASNSRNSNVKVLVTDLEEGERRRYSCIASVIRSREEPRISTWSIEVIRISE